MKLVAVAAALVAFSACTGEPGGPPISDGPDGGAPATPAALDRCLAGGGGLGSLDVLGNLHGEITALALSAQGRIVLASEDGALKLWTLEGEEADRPATYDSAFSEEAPIARALAWAPDGTWVAAGRDDGAVERWGVDGVRVAGMSTAETPMTAVAIAPDGKQVVSADDSYAGNVRVWEASGEVSEPLPTTLWAVDALAFLSDGRLIIAGDWYGVPSVELRDAGALATTIGVWLGNAEVAGTVHAIAASADERRLAIAGEGFVGVLDLGALDADPPAMVTMALDHDAVAVAWSPDEQYLLTLGREGTLRVWTAEGVAVSQLEVTAAGLLLDPASGRVITAGLDGYIHVFACEEP